MDLISLALILLKVEFTFTWPIDCNDVYDCCSFEVLHENGTMRIQKPACQHFDISNNDTGKIVSAKNVANIEYYVFKSDSMSHVLRLNWIEFRLSGTMTSCTKDKVYVQVG